MKANYEEPSMEIIEISDEIVTVSLQEYTGGEGDSVDFASDDWFL